MKKLLLILMTLMALNSIGNIAYINYEKIPNFESYKAQFKFLTQNVQYFNHWVSDWTYDKNKDSLIFELNNCYNIFSKIDSNNLEINLLLGDISHYLYNLNEEKYFEIAEKYYKKAINITPDDFRPSWFLANHYALANHPEKSIEYFLVAQKLLPKNEPADFWNEYAFATAIANMPSHSIYAMDKAKQILKAPGYFEEQLGPAIHKRIVAVKDDSTYSFRNIWTASNVASYVTFVCRPLGIKLLIDSTWQINFYDYKNNQSAITIVPAPIISKEGRSITYTIAILIKREQKGDNLEKYINNFISKYDMKQKISFSNKYPGMISYDLKDKNMYPEMGGGHMNMIGIKRVYPSYPGLILEDPVLLPEGKTGEVTYFQAGESINRFNGVLYYAIMLDACEDIYENAFQVFKEMFDNLIIIE